MSLIHVFLPPWLDGRLVLWVGTWMSRKGDIRSNFLNELQVKILSK
jgi:hypothetical protein